jgi:hypothetical protein
MHEVYDEYVVQFIEIGRFGWAEHVMRMDKIDLAKKVLFIKLGGGAGGKWREEKRQTKT